MDVTTREAVGRIDTGAPGSHRFETGSVEDLDTLEVLNSLQAARRGEPGAHGLAYIPRGQ